MSSIITTRFSSRWVFGPKHRPRSSGKHVWVARRARMAMGSTYSPETWGRERAIPPMATLPSIQGPRMYGSCGTVDGAMEVQWTVLNSGFNGADAAFDAAMGTGQHPVQRGASPYGRGVPVAKHPPVRHLRPQTPVRWHQRLPGRRHVFQRRDGDRCLEGRSMRHCAPSTSRTARATLQRPGPPIPRRRSDGAQDAWLIKADAQGTLQWQHAYGSSGHDVFFEVHHTTDGGFVMAGHTDTEDG